MPTLTFHGQSCWEVQGKDHRILIDPFLTDNPLADVGVDHFDKLDAILITHMHPDHIPDVDPIAEKTGAIIVASNEVANYYGGKGFTSHPMHIGGQREFPFGRVKLTIAHHSSSTPEGVAVGVPTGIVLTMDGKKIYHAGDTGVFLDMKLIGELNGPLDVALLPIGDNFTMGIDEAVKAAELVQAKMNIPMHYNTWPVIEANPGEFIRRVEGVGLAAQVVEPGGSYVA